MECSSGYLVKGPSVRLAPGSYTVGVQGITAQAGDAPLDGKLTIEVLFGNDVSIDLSAAELDEGAVSADLTLTEVREVAVKLRLYAAASASVEAIFITRH